MSTQELKALDYALRFMNQLGGANAAHVKTLTDLCNFESGMNDALLKIPARSANGLYLDGYYGPNRS